MAIKTISPQAPFTSIAINKNTEEKKTPSIPSFPRLIKNNGEAILSKGRELTYTVVDIGGSIRQTAEAIQAGSLLTHKVALSSIAGSATPIGLLFTGPLSMATAAAWTIPDSIRERNERAKEVQHLKNRSPEQLEEAKTVLSLANLSVANQSLYFVMGANQSALGAVTLCGSSSIAHTLGYAPIMGSNAAYLAMTITGVALGVIYTTRGTVMMIRSVKSYARSHEFYKEFRNTLPKGNDSLTIKHIEQALSHMEKEETKEESYLSRRIDLSCLESMDSQGRAFRYTAKGLQYPNGTLVSHTEKSKLEYLQRVYKGIQTEKLKHQISITIAAAMIIGGILAVVLSVMTGGVGAVAIALASAIFFICMESIFASYDSSRVFEWIRDLLYASPPQWLQPQSEEMETSTINESTIS